MVHILMSDSMSTPPASLAARHADLTQKVILDAALDELAAAPAEPLTVRGVAKRAGISERTVFRYYAAREDLLNGAAAEYARRMDFPPLPSDRDSLIAYPAAVYAAFEAKADLTRAALHSELYERVRSTDAAGRMAAIQGIVDALAPARSAADRRIAAANIHYHVIASTWWYYRTYFGFDPQEAARAARTVIAQTLEGLANAK